MNDNSRQVSFKESLIVFIILIFSLIIGVAILKIDLTVVLLISLFIIISFSMIKGYSLEYIKSGMANSITRTYDALLIFILIGANIGIWILSGTIPSLIYYGLNILSPNIFLPAGLLICSLTSLATGTSWGTVSTVGIALLAIGQSLGIPVPLIAGMIVSGAFFGDKISPMSDTTNLAAASTNTNLYDHISSMLYTTIPSYLLALIIYTVLGLNYKSSYIDYTQVNLIQNTLNNTFNISLFTLIPIIVVIVLSILKKPALISMSIGVVTGVFIAVFIQDASFKEALTVLNTGYTVPTNVDIVDKLILRGGIQSMMSTFSLAFIALSLGGILDEIGYLKVLVEKILLKVEKVGSLIAITILSCILSNTIMGEAYLSIILNGRLYESKYKSLGLQSRMLSRSLEEGSTLTTGLIPWTTAGAFISGTLGVSTLAYAPFAFFNLLNPFISILFSYLGIFVLKSSKK